MEPVEPLFIPSPNKLCSTRESRLTARQTKRKKLPSWSKVQRLGNQGLVAASNTLSRGTVTAQDVRRSVIYRPLAVLKSTTVKRALTPAIVEQLVGDELVPAEYYIEFDIMFLKQ